ncbi:sensor histidine kinase [Tellurirhabdus bombi]|uniref:sensor histidine kinase n=1 Tax=Tellurirhabdus bombi TaxID=2907205 RepID=UPI001F344A86|nr:sensor histidine kinase [Tellurirhabdus bombi]
MTSKLSQVGIHVFFCLAFLALPYIFAPKGFSLLSELTTNLHERTNLLAYLLMLAFFYVNYYILIPRLYFSGRYVIFAGSLLGCFVVIIGLLLTVDRQDVFQQSPPLTPYELPDRRPSPLDHPGSEPIPDSFSDGSAPGRRQPKPPFGFELSHALFLFLVGVFVSLSLRINNRLRKAEQEKLATELSYLKAQINPHFLFNTLNSIYSLAIEQSDRTAEAIVKLSALMRYVIRDAHSDLVPVTKELEYISHYISLQKIRLDDTAQIFFTTEGLPNGKQIAPLILISFIENAFKYGVNPEEDSVIEVAISLNEKELHLYVFNKKVRVVHNEGSTSGIGIENTKARLQLLYPNQHQLTIQDTDFTFTVDLTLRLS